MPIQGGYILLARKISESGIMDKPPLYFKLWVWMLEQANHKDGYKGLNRGQFFTTIEEMREAMSWHIGYRKVTPTRKEIRNPYEWFMKGHMIDITKVTHGMIITVLNYDEYQNPKNYEGRTEGPNEKDTKGQRGAQYNNKNGKNERINIPSNFHDLSKRFHEYQHKQIGKSVSVDEKTIQTGAEELERLVRLDKFDLDNEIRPSLQWAVQDDFWSKQLLSLAAIRKKSKNGATKFKNMYAAYQAAKPKNPKIPMVY